MHKFFPYLWSLLNTGGSQAIGFLASLVIARAASPDDFGVLAVCSSIVLVFNIFAEGGLATVLVVDKKFCNKKASTALIVITIIAFISFFIILFAAELLAEILGVARVKDVIPIMALATVASSLGCVHSAYVTRTLQFKKKSIISLVSSLIGSASGILIAYLVDPLTGLVTMYVTIPCLITAGLWASVSWGFHMTFKPRLVFSDLKFSLNIVASNLLDQSSKSILVLFVNKIFGINDLGLYNRGEAIRNITTQTADKVVQRVAFPVLSESSRVEGKSTSFLESTKIAMVLLLILVPSVYFLTNNALGIVDVLFGKKWLAVSPILKIISLVGLFIPLTSLHFSFMKASGDAALVTMNKIFALACYMPLFFFYAERDLDSFLYAVVLHAGFMFIVSVFSLYKLDGVELPIYIQRLVGACFIASIPVFLHKYLISFELEGTFSNLVANLATLSLMTMLIYFVVNLVLKRKSAYLL